MDTATVTSIDDLTSEDVLDSRQLQDIIDDLEAEEPEDLDDDQKALLAALIEVRDECSSEWEGGLTLVRDSYFEDYAQEEAESYYDLGELGNFRYYIDWEKWARDLKMDYTSVEIGDTTYWARS